MTAASVPVGGQGRLVGLAPANTSEATMFTAGKEFPVVVGIVIANSTGSSANATLKWGDGSTDYVLYGTNAIAAYTTVHVPTYLPLREGYTIKVTSGTNNAITFTLALVATGSFLTGANASSR